MSEATQRLVQGLVETTFAGSHAIKGKAEPQKVYRLDSIRAGATRFEAAIGRGLTSYVGREREMEILALGLAEARGELRVIDIVAEPGMGKRLRRGLPLNRYDRSTFYGGDARGYTDYPAYGQAQSAA